MCPTLMGYRRLLSAPIKAPSTPESWARPGTHESPITSHGTCQGQPDVSKQRLQDLPVDVILTICDWLPPSSVATLATSSHQMLNVIGKAWISLGRESRLEFLRHYQIKMPRHYLCQVCVKYHQLIDDNGEYLYLARCHRTEPSVFSSPLDMYEWTFADLQVRFIKVQLVMDRHFLGQDFGLDPTILWDIRMGADSTTYNFSHVQVREARIVKDELIFETIHRFYEKVPGRGDDIAEELQQRALYLCPHLQTLDSTQSPDGVQGIYLLALRGSHISYEGFNKTVVISAGQCCFCATEYELSIRVTRHGMEFHMMCWQNLGSCRTPDDPKWQTCCDGRNYGSESPGRYLCLPLMWEAGSIRMAFNSVPSTAETRRTWNATYKYHHFKKYGACYPSSDTGTLPYQSIEHNGKHYYDRQYYDSYYSRQDELKREIQAREQNHRRVGFSQITTWLKRVTLAIKSRIGM